MPSCEVLAIAHVAVDSDVLLARVRRDKDEGSILLLGKVASALEVEVVEKVRNRGVIFASPNADCFERLR